MRGNRRATIRVATRASAAQLSLRAVRQIETLLSVQSQAMEPEAAVQMLRKQIETGEALLANRPLTKSAFSQWHIATRHIVERLFGADSETFRIFRGGGGGIASVPINPSEAQMEHDRTEALESQLAKLRGLLEIKSLDLHNYVSASASAGLDRRTVFIVHGHDNTYRLEAARFVEKLGLDVIILHEQPNAGRTLIEKLEKSATSAGFAVVLMTPDDRGGKAEPRARLSPRARQNVIFELGYFVGRMGRDRVCALHAPDVEVPSDIHGVAYVPLDEAGAWKRTLARELLAADMDIDMNGIVK
jgi:predicted nucleotide-binding protein